MPTAAGKYALIAFVSDRDGAPELYTMKPDGPAQTRLTNTQGKDTLPDGTKIAFLSERS